MKVITNNIISGVNKNSCSHISATSVADRVNSECLNNTLNQLSFLGKTQVFKSVTKAKVLEKHSDFLGELGENVKEGIKGFISDCRDGSRELLDIDTLLETFNPEKYFGKKILGNCDVPPDIRVLKGIKKGRKIPQALSDDLEMLRKSGSLTDNYIPVLSSSDAALKAKTGDVFRVNGSDMVSMKTRDGSVEELKMSADDFIDLFPPVKRFAGIQSEKFGNCYEENALYSILSNPETRENIFRAINTVGKKDKVLVKLPNSLYKEGVSFKPSDISDNGKDYYTQGCKGLQIIQHALGLDYEKEFIDCMIKELTKKGKDSQVAWVDQNRNKSYLLARHFRGRYPDASLGVNLRDGGSAVMPWYKLGLHDAGESTLVVAKKYEIVEEEIPSKFKHETDNRPYRKNYKGEIFTEELNEFWDRLASEDFMCSHATELAVSEDNVVSKFKPDHSYGLRAVRGDNGEIKEYMVKDPHEITETPLDFEEILDNFDYMSFARFK